MNKEIGSRIKKIRQQKAITREVLAAQVEISTKFLYEIEMGKKGFSADVLYKISKSLSISSDYLLTGNGESTLPGEVVNILKSFSPYQMGHLTEVLIHIQEMCIPEKEQ